MKVYFIACWTANIVTIIAIALAFARPAYAPALMALAFTMAVTFAMAHFAIVRRTSRNSAA